MRKASSSFPHRRENAMARVVVPFKLTETVTQNMYLRTEKKGKSKYLSFFLWLSPSKSLLQRTHQIYQVGSLSLSHTKMLFTLSFCVWSTASWYIFRVCWVSVKFIINELYGVRFDMKMEIWFACFGAINLFVLICCASWCWSGGCKARKTCWEF